tara:strand:- start:9546 stop:10355 length:810 start_codon:yes stop_codon:yes gene_type:complete
MNNKITISDSIFPVKEVPAYWETTKKNKGNGTSAREMQTSYKFIVRKDTDEVLSCMSNNYQLIKNSDLIEVASPFLEDRCAKLKECEVFGNGNRTTWKYLIPDIKLEIDKGDFVNPEVIIKNSYDGTSEASIIAGAFRLVCSNGMVIGYTLGKNSIRHTIWNRNIDMGEIIDEVLSSIDTVFQGDFRNLIETEIKNQSHITKMIELFPQNQTKNIVSKMISSPPKNYWNLLNAATWVTTHCMNRQSESTHRFESKLYPMVNKFANQIQA